MKNKREFNLIDQAIHKLSNAEYYYNKIDRDTMQEDYIIRDCCLELQMSVELFIKGFVEQLCGMDYEYKHQYYQNLNKIKSNKLNIKNYDELEKILDDIDDKAELLVKWHTHSVYVSGFRTTIKQIDDVLNIARRLKTYWENVEIENKKFNTNSYKNNNTKIMSVYTYNEVEKKIKEIKREENEKFWNTLKQELEEKIKSNTVKKDGETMFIIKKRHEQIIIAAYNIKSKENAIKLIKEIK